jgi:hypothetical protein
VTDELAIERGQNWTPIGGQDCTPFDILPANLGRERHAAASPRPIAQPAMS